jgi:G3E family GTPase
MIKITIITGFLGSGKTTLVNQIIKENSDVRFGLIINEFGEVGVDSELVAKTDQEITEISNGCLCCVVRSDLTGAVQKMIDTGKVDHIIIETSGLAEPAPIAQTFIMDNLNNQVELDAIFCVIDADNFEDNIKHYNILKEQLQTSDVAIINKIDDNKIEFNNNLITFVTSQNPTISILKNNTHFDSKILLDFKETLEEKIVYIEGISEHSHHHDHDDHSEHDHHHHAHHDHSHEHNDFTEILFKTDKELDEGKLDQIFLKDLPKNIIRAKGFLHLKSKLFLFQMVGTHKKLTEYTPSPNSKFDFSYSYLIFIGKDIDKVDILAKMNTCIK